MLDFKLLEVHQRSKIKDLIEIQLRHAPTKVSKSKIERIRGLRHPHRKPAGVLIGFEDEEDWFDYRLETDPRFLKRIEKARHSLKSGMGTKIEII